MKILDLKELQKEETDMLKSIIKFLKDYDINYYIWYGTLLGAVRHHGFIPWDDDIDIAICRKDYDLLLNILQHNCKIDDNLEAIGFEIGKGDFPFIKIVNKDIMVCDKKGIDKYLWIDIFPLDSVPEHNRFYYLCISIFREIHSLKRYSYYNIKIENKGIKKVIKKILIFLLRPLKMETLLRIFISFCKKNNYKDTRFVSNNVWGIKRNEKIELSVLKNHFYTFENLNVNGIEEYDLLLKKLYGNYMELPPIEKRKKHLLKAWRKKTK